MRRFAIALVTGAALSVGYSQIATAADMPVKAPVYKAPPAIVVYNWTGFYVGGHAGIGWARSDANWDPLPTPAAFNAQPVSFALKGSGFVGGAQVGFNWQAPGSIWVFGIEGDWSWADINDSASQTVNFSNGTPAPPARVDMSRDIDWLASIRGRLGVTVTPTMLAYITGGYAAGKVKYHGFFQTNALIVWPTVDLSNTETGYVVGGGLEWAFAGNWLLRGEYLYYDLGGETVNQPGPVGFLPILYTWHHNKIHVARAALSFKFGP